MKRWTTLLLTLTACCQHAGAIEAPASSSTQAPEEAQEKAAPIAPSDESGFVTVLQNSAHRRNLTGLEISPDIIAALARADVAEAIARLDQQAASGSSDANIALVRIQHWCNRVSSSRLPEPQAQIAKLPPTLAPQRAARAAGVIVAEERYRRAAGESCVRARFDYGGIEARLRQAADAGEPASATELAVFTRDPARKKALLETAATKGFAPAQHILAQQRLIAVQRGETTEDVGSIRLLLKQAGLSINKAKVDLANCMALGCDGHPADAAGAAAFGIDAARDGEPSAFLSMARMAWGMRMKRTQLLAWQYFGDRLSEAGCVGENYVASTIVFDQTIKTLERQLGPGAVEQARAQAETLWRDHADRAKREQGCAR